MTAKAGIAVGVRSYKVLGATEFSRTAPIDGTVVFEGTAEAVCKSTFPISP